MSIEDSNSYDLINRGVDQNVGNKLKSKSYWPYPNGGTNESGFSAIPAGLTVQELLFDYDVVKEQGWWWTATENTLNTDNAILRNLETGYSGITRDNRYHKTYSLS
jgi:uncharacterized protein (TIGR02145 family)